MNKNIVVINGTGGSGKDTFVEFAAHYGKIQNFSSIDKVKDIAKIVGWDGGKTEKDRKFLSDLKRLTTEYNDMSFHSVEHAIKKFQVSSASVLFIHIREPEEIKRVVERFKAKTLLIKRRGLLNIQSNPSDANVENYPYDFVIENTTLETLNAQAKEFIIMLEKISL